MNIRTLFFVALYLTVSLSSQAQDKQPAAASLPPKANLQHLIDFALGNKSNVKQATIDEAIADPSRRARRA
jgi:hypothetical protein